MCAPPAAVRGPSEGYFTCANPSAVVPGIHPSQSGVSGFVFSQVSAALPRHAFAPFSATGSGYGQVGTSPRNIYYFVIMRRNALMCAYLSWGPPLDLTLFFSGTYLRNTCFMFVLLTVTILSFIWLSTKFWQVDRITGSLLFWGVTRYVISRWNYGQLSMTTFPHTYAWPISHATDCLSPRLDPPPWSPHPIILLPTTTLCNSKQWLVPNSLQEWPQVVLQQGFHLVSRWCCPWWMFKCSLWTHPWTLRYVLNSIKHLWDNDFYFL